MHAQRKEASLLVRCDHNSFGRFPCMHHPVTEYISSQSRHVEDQSTEILVYVVLGRSLRYAEGLSYHSPVFEPFGPHGPVFWLFARLRTAVRYTALSKSGLANQFHDILIV